jgi:hypothetical protein
MASDVPGKDLRPLADWRAELGLVRLKADLINRDLDAWYYDPLTGQWHQIPRRHWQGKVAGRDALEHALGWGWPIGGGLSAPDIHIRSCAIHAARPGPSVTPTATEASQPPLPEQRRTAPGWAQKVVIRKLREKYHPDGIPPKGTSISEACREIGEDPERRWQTVDRAIKRLKEANRLRG